MTLMEVMVKIMLSFAAAQRKEQVKSVISKAKPAKKPAAGLC